MAILRAVIYAAVFEFPLSAEELWRSLPRHKTSIDTLKRAIAERPFLRERIDVVDGWYVPAGRRDLMERRRQRERSSRAFLARHRRTLDVICTLPFTRLVAISGSLAHLNADENADLDLFIVTHGPHVWTVALLLVIISRLMRRRKVVCANFLLADSHLVLDQHDLYTASQVLHLRPVIGADTQARFVEANPFVREWFPNAKDATPVEFPLPAPGGLQQFKRVLELLLWIPSRPIEAVCRQIYGWHLRRRISRWRSPEQVRLEPSCLKLHTHSHRKAVLDRFEALVAESVRKGKRSSGPHR
ncbi:MAG TPA: hypothetical protein VMZ90_14810 [Vicinamibacterales bacterium]|nr:hypothetical protein [Vicinamibacterales bacterium]